MTLTGWYQTNVKDLQQKFARQLFIEERRGKLGLGLLTYSDSNGL
jgi:hypothetical protein